MNNRKKKDFLTSPHLKNEMNFYELRIQSIKREHEKGLRRPVFSYRLTMTLLGLVRWFSFLLVFSYFFLRLYFNIQSIVISGKSIY